MIIDILGTILLTVVTVSITIVFLCICVIGLAVLDFALDSDIKGALVKWLGPRHFLKKLRIKMLQLMNKIDKPEENDIPLGKTAEDWQPDEDYNKEIKDLLGQVIDKE